VSTTEYALVALVIIIPAIVAAGVTLWTLEQALKRNKKNRQSQGGGRDRPPESSGESSV
jgi:hypothetical protein